MKLEEVWIPEGWHLYYAEEEGTGRISCHLQQDQPDSHHPGSRWVYGEYFWVSNMDDQEILTRIYTTMQFLIIHEFSENFKHRGMAVFDQHKVPADIERIHELIVTERKLM